MTFIKNYIKKISIPPRNIGASNDLKIIHLLAITGLLIRIFVAFTSEQIHHPDEVFQYLEQAHRLVFGYGYIPWEYRFGTRSWILPGFISSFLYVFKFLKIDEPILYINFIKVFFCCISSSLVYSAYIITRQLSSDKAGKIAAVFVCFWYELIYFAHKPTPEVLATYLFMAALAIAVIKSGNFNSLLFGLLCALTTILRLQYIIPVGFLMLYTLLRWKKKESLLSLTSFFILIGAAGYFDYLTWGEFFISYYNNFVFNKIYNLASLFGTKPLCYYIVSLTVSSMGIFYIAGLLSFKFLRDTWLLLVIILSTIISHSIIPHKEHRFIFLMIPILLMVSSIVITEIRVKHISRKMFLFIVFFIFFAISLAGSFNKLPFQRHIYRQSIFSQDGILNAYLFLSKETDLHAILNTSIPWYSTGGYYYLHRDVPIYSSDHFDPNDSKNYLPYVSHIVCPAGYRDIPGFRTVKEMKSIEIRKQINPPSEYQSTPYDTKNVMQEGIDDKYTPDIHK